MTDEATAVFLSQHSDIFPTRNCLQLKIREVRQKMMATSQEAEPNDTSTPESRKRESPTDMRRTQANSEESPQDITINVDS